MEAAPPPELVAPHAYFITGDVPEFDSGPQASLNAQFLPPSMSRYRRVAATGDSGLQEQALRERRLQQQHQQQQQQQLQFQHHKQQLQQLQQEQQQLQQQHQAVLSDPESERDRMFRMRAMYLQQQQLLERQKEEDERQHRMQLAMQQQRRPGPLVRSQPSLPLPVPHQPPLGLSVPTSSGGGGFHEPEFELPPRRLHRELQPAPSSTSTATLTSSVSPQSSSASSFAPRASATQSPPVAAGSLSLPLPPSLSSTARRFAAPEPSVSSSSSVEPPPRLEPRHSSGKPAVARRSVGQQPQQPRGDASAASGSTTSFRSAGAEQQRRRKPSARDVTAVVDAQPRPVSDEPQSDEQASDGGSDSAQGKKTTASAHRHGSSNKRRAPTTPPTVRAAVPPTAESEPGEPKRRCGRKSMNYSSEEKRERNRAAVKKCRQRQALKYDYLLQKAEVLATENTALSDLLVNNVDLEEERRVSLTRGIQMDILFKIKEIFTQSLPKDFVLDADSIWDLNSVLAVSMPSRCYYGIESIKEFWRTSLRMRNKGKIRSFWAWLFRLPPGDRFADFDIIPFSDSSNLYFVTWTTKSDPPLSGSMVIMFGQGHRVTLHVECFGWLIWRYLLTNEPFPEPNE